LAFLPLFLLPPFDRLLECLRLRAPPTAPGTAGVGAAGAAGAAGAFVPNNDDELCFGCSGVDWVNPILIVLYIILNIINP